MHGCKDKMVYDNLPEGFIAWCFIFVAVSLLHKSPLQQLMSQRFTVPVLLTKLQKVFDLQTKEFEQLRLTSVTFIPEAGSINTLGKNQFQNHL